MDWSDTIAKKPACLVFFRVEHCKATAYGYVYCYAEDDEAGYFLKKALVFLMAVETCLACLLFAAMGKWINGKQTFFARPSSPVKV